MNTEPVYYCILLHVAVEEYTAGSDAALMGHFNHGHIQWKSLEGTGGEDQQILFLIQESFLTQHVLEPTRGENVLDIVYHHKNN